MESSPEFRTHKGRGRRSKLNPERSALIADLLRDGVPLKRAAYGAGVDYETVRGWLRRGAAAAGGPYREFFLAVRKAEADFLAIAASRVNQVGLGAVIRVPVCDEKLNPLHDQNGERITVEKYCPPQLRALTWELERRFPDEYARRRESAVQVNTQVNTAAPVGLGKKDKLTLLQQAVRILRDAGTPRELFEPREPPPAIESGAEASTDAEVIAGDGEVIAG